MKEKKKNKPEEIKDKTEKSSLGKIEIKKGIIKRQVILASGD